MVQSQPRATREALEILVNLLPRTKRSAETELTSAQEFFKSSELFNFKSFKKPRKNSNSKVEQEAEVLARALELLASPEKVG